MRTARAVLFTLCTVPLAPGCNRNVPTRDAPEEQDSSGQLPAPDATAPPGGSADLSLALPSVTTPNLPATRHAVGQKASATDYELSVLELRECKVEDYFEPSAENFLLGVKMAFAGLSERRVPVSPFHAVIEDDSDHEYRPTLAGCRPSLRSQRISKDDEASGYVTFELPRSARGLTLSYTPFIVGSTPQTLSFDLGR